MNKLQAQLVILDYLIDKLADVISNENLTFGKPIRTENGELTCNDFKEIINSAHDTLSTSHQILNEIQDIIMSDEILPYIKRD